MIETIDYAVQFCVLLVCCAVTGLRAARTKDRGLLILAFFYACYALGDLYWALCMGLEGATPKVSYISELSWSAGVIFLCLLLRLLHSEPVGRGWIPWLAPVFTFAAAVYFMRWGEYVYNLVCAGLFGWMGYLVLRGLLGAREHGNNRMLYCSVGAFFVLEYAMWFISCYWLGDTLVNPYFWCDGLMTLVLISLIPGYRKAVTA